MHRYVFARAALGLFVLAVDVGRAVVLIVDRVIDFCLSIIAPAEPLRFALDGPALAFDAPGAPLDASLLQGLRHEARVRRRSADRNI